MKSLKPKTTIGKLEDALPVGFENIKLDSLPFRKALEELFWGTETLSCVIGPGGCGKSVLLRMAAHKFGSRCLCVAPTGVAAQNISDEKIKAKTIHSAFGVPISNVSVAGFSQIKRGISSNNYEKLHGKEVKDPNAPLFSTPQVIYKYFPAEDYIKHLNKAPQREAGHLVKKIKDTLLDPYVNGYAIEALKDKDLILMDEVSMVNANLFDYVLLQITYAMRKYNRQIRLVCFGDPLQLPPVDKSNGQDSEPELGKMFWESRFWKELDPHVYCLNAVYRQKDNTFKEVLNHLRMGEFTDRDKEVIKSRVRQSIDINEKTLAIMSERRLVDNYNQKKQGELINTGAEKFLVPYSVEGYVSDVCLSKEKDGFFGDLTFYAGERVMCTKNAPDGSYRNGTLGTFIEAYEGPAAKVLLDSGETVIVKPFQYGPTESSATSAAQIYQIPLVSAYAITYHKSQGLTLDTLYMDVQNLKEDGMFYLGMSRVRSLEGLTLSAVPDWNKIKPNEKALKFVKEMEALSEISEK
jgi:hypothetical protein